MNVTKKILSLLLAVCMIFGLAACGQSNSNGPKTAAELLTLNEKTVRNNYMQTIQMTVDTKIINPMLDKEVSMPVEIAVAAAVFDENHMHSSSDSKMVIYENDVHSKTDMYMVDDVIYMSTNNADDSPIYLKTTREEAGLKTISTSDLTDVNVFNNATMTFDSTLNQYVVTVNTEDLLKYVSLQELLSGALDGLNQIDQEAYQSMIEAFGKSHVTYYYNQAYELVKCEIKDMTYEYADAGVGTIQMSIYLNMEFSDYGKITEKDVAVPDAFKNAVDLASILEPDNETPTTVGSWEKVEDGTITDELQAIYDAVSTEDSGYRLKQLVATQLVSGMNYLFLVEDENGNEGLIGVYKDLEGNVSLLDRSLLPSEFVPTNDDAGEADDTSTWLSIVYDDKNFNFEQNVIGDVLSDSWLKEHNYVDQLSKDGQKDIMLENDANSQLIVYAINRQEDSKDLKDCGVIGFIYEIFNGEPTHSVVVCDDISFESNEEEVLTKLGTPNYTHNFTESNLAEYDWDIVNDAHTFHINAKFDNGKMVKLSFFVD